MTLINPEEDIMFPFDIFAKPAVCAGVPYVAAAAGAAAAATLGFVFGYEVGESAGYEKANAKIDSMLKGIETNLVSMAKEGSK